jgi:hypothetical protein
MRSGERLGDVGACAEAGVDKVVVAQPGKSPFIGRGPIRLNLHRLVPFEAEPAQILENSVDEPGTRTALIEILDPQ